MKSEINKVLLTIPFKEFKIRIRVILELIIKVVFFKSAKFFWAYITVKVPFRSKKK